MFKEFYIEEFLEKEEDIKINSYLVMSYLQNYVYDDV